VRLTTSGDWPNRIVYRQAWAKALARPWNDDMGDASLRLVRGSSGFVRSVAEHLIDGPAAGVASPPLLGSAQRTWRRAGFEPFLALHMYRRSLSGPIPPADVPVKVISHPDWRRMAEVDRAAFDIQWRMNQLALREAHAATPRAAVLVTDTGPQITGFAVVGLGGTSSYLQRIAVDPGHQGHGLGRALVRVAMAWASKRGALVMMLNTQPENTTSAGLYQAEGFRRMGTDLDVLRFAGSAG
jgi:GNAT superfamily N-acetyltransferase